MPLFKSFFLGGFECSTHKRGDGVRLDLLALTGHDVQAERDYRLLQRHGMHAARDGLRWYLIERFHGQYDWSSWLPQLRAAKATGMEVVWDLFHYGWPSGVDPFSAATVDRFAAFTRAAATVLRDEGVEDAWFCAVNEISFLAWGGGDKGEMNPFAVNRGGELKAQLVRMAVAATEAVREVLPAARFVTAEPLINILPRSHEPHHVQAVADHMEGQYEAVDMLLGRRAPELGGTPAMIDALGINYYFNNQWIDCVGMLALGDPRHVPLRDLLARVHDRYGLPMFIAETGTEGAFRGPWLNYIGQEVALARAAGVPVGGVCLYPVLSHRGWDDERHCPNGLFDAFAPDSDRAAYAPLAAELARQQAVAQGVAAGQD